MKYLLNFTLAFLLLVTSCSKTKVGQFDEVYEVEMVGIWSSTTHPTDFPSNAHFSPMIGISHIAALDVIGIGLSATEGIKSMAETGATIILDEEFDLFRNQTYSLDKFTGASFDSPGSNKSEIGVERGKHNVTIFSMIAPSPDWFVAVSTSLIDPVDEQWYDEVTVYATSYDAGTDSGVSFASANLVSSPLEGVHIIEEGPLTEGMDTVKNVAKFIFRRVTE
ncbi:MAG: hypothetical protein ACI8ZX_003005 [Planctomycetota bacterium]|jgi:hypothetical protein